MSYIALHTLVGTALTDRAICEGLLNGQRPTILGAFDLTDEEREVALAIEADSIWEFAARLDEWLQAQESPPDPAPFQGQIAGSRAVAMAAY